MPGLSSSLANAFSVAALVLVIDFLRESRAIARYAQSIGGDRRTGKLDIARAIGGHIFKTVTRAPDPAFLTSCLAALGATPEQVLRQGGCCSGISRLFILTLRKHGIRAAQITLYHTTGRAQHCLVEVRDGPQQLVIDADYGFSYHAADGSPLSLEQLRRGVTPVFLPLPGSSAASYPPSGYYEFAFENTKTANWTKSTTRRLVYRVVAPATFGRVDTLRLPSAMEWPQLLLAAPLVVCAALLQLLAA